MTSREIIKAIFAHQETPRPGMTFSRDRINDFVELDRANQLVMFINAGLKVNRNFTMICGVIFGYE